MQINYPSPRDTDSHPSPEMGESQYITHISRHVFSWHVHDIIMISTAVLISNAALYWNANWTDRFLARFGTFSPELTLSSGWNNTKPLAPWQSSLCTQLRPHRRVLATGPQAGGGRPELSVPTNQITTVSKLAYYNLRAQFFKAWWYGSKIDIN